MNYVTFFFLLVPYLCLQVMLGIQVLPEVDATVSTPLPPFHQSKLKRLLHSRCHNPLHQRFNDNDDGGLDHQLELENLKRHMERKQATDWIVDIVSKNITAKAEDDALKKCIANLKGMAAK